jgi:release factor glutamine methyltransferase
MKYSEIINKLKAISPDEYEFEAKILLEHFTQKNIAYYHMNQELEFDCSSLEEALHKREEHIPLQYIIGKWDFYRQTYFVNENCLIPRSDTEILVEKAIELLPNNAHFLDLCTGSGCIAISTLAERKDTTAIMVDKFPQTLEIASKNAVLNGVDTRCTPLLIDVLEEENRLLGMQFDAILSNPPYIRPEVIEGLSEEVKNEPYAALYGGEDGLIFYNKIVKDYSPFLKKDGFILFEIGYDQAFALKLISEKNGYYCEIFKDYGGNDRVALLRKNKMDG